MTLNKQVYETAIQLYFCLSALCAHAQQTTNNDEFDQASSLDQWFNITNTSGYSAEHFEIVDVNTTNLGRLTLQPYTSAWFANYRGGFLYKELTGDFVFTTEVSATTSGSTTYSLGGLFLRSPQSAMQEANNIHNYIFLATGYADPGHTSCPGICPSPHLEVKNTVNSNSVLRVAPVAGGPVEIRIARLGDYIICLYRPSASSDFIVHERYEREDFPNTIQAGFVAYTDWPKVQTYSPSFHNNNVLNEDLIMDPSTNPGLAFDPDITATFEYARFDDVTVPIGLELSNATDEQLLDFLGYEPSVALPVTWGNVRATVSDEAITLDWDVEYLEDHDVFVVEYSHGKGDFSPIARIHENREGQKAFSFVHTDPLRGRHYYRIKQVDLDGSISYSQVVTAHLAIAGLDIVPNPAHDRLYVRGDRSYSSLILTDSRGIVHAQIERPVHEIDVSLLSSGMYFLTAIFPEYTQVERVLIK